MMCIDLPCISDVLHITWPVGSIRADRSVHTPWSPACERISTIRHGLQRECSAAVLEVSCRWTHREPRISHWSNETWVSSSSVEIARLISLDDRVDHLRRAPLTQLSRTESRCRDCQSVRLCVYSWKLLVESDHSLSLMITDDHIEMSPLALKKSESKGPLIMSIHAKHISKTMQLSRLLEEPILCRYVDQSVSGHWIEQGSLSGARNADHVELGRRLRCLGSRPRPFRNMLCKHEQTANAGPNAS